MMGSWIFFVKIVVASAAVLSAAVAFRLAAPVGPKFLAAKAPRMCATVAAWLTPPYLYFIINGIIISIAATSRFQKTVTTSRPAPYPSLSAPPLPASAKVRLFTPGGYISKVVYDADLRPEFLAPADPESEDEIVISRSSWLPKSRRGSIEDLPERFTGAACSRPAEEKPPVSARLSRRKSIKPSLEGKALRVARPRKHETLDSTWRTITDGRPVPFARLLKKSETWESHSQANAAEPALEQPEKPKSETFTALSSTSAGSTSRNSGGRTSSSVGKLRRELSLGLDDLNRRVEAFIKKFNEEMRLQRQQSLQQYMDMIGRSSH